MSYKLSFYLEDTSIILRSDHLPLKDYFKRLRFKQVFSSPYYPQGDGCTKNVCYHMVESCENFGLSSNTGVLNLVITTSNLTLLKVLKHCCRTEHIQSEIEDIEYRCAIFEPLPKTEVSVMKVFYILPDHW